MAFDDDPEDQYHGAVKLYGRVTNIMINFYNYLLHHNVCTEYNDNILAARSICQLGAKELPLVLKADFLLPGPFNVACSTLFGGKHQKLYAENMNWDPSLVVVRSEESRIRAMAGFLMHGVVEPLDIAEEVGTDWPKHVRCSMPIQSFFEVVKIEPLSPDSEDYTDVVEHVGDEKVRLEPCGGLYPRRLPAPEFQDYDLPPKSRDSAIKTAEQEYEEDRFILEASILDCMYPRMKFEAVIRLTPWNWAYIDSVSKVYCSFHEYLANELIKGPSQWKDLKWFKKRNVEMTEEEIKDMERIMRLAD